MDRVLPSAPSCTSPCVPSLPPRLGTEWQLTKRHARTHSTLYEPAPPPSPASSAAAAELALLASAAAAAERADTQDGSARRRRRPAHANGDAKVHGADDADAHDDDHGFGSSSSTNDDDDDDDDDETMDSGLASPDHVSAAGDDHDRMDTAHANGNGRGAAGSATHHAGGRAAHAHLRHRRPNGAAAEPAAQDILPSSMARVDRIRHRFQGKLQRRALSGLHQFYGKTSQGLTTIRVTVTLIQVRPGHPRRPCAHPHKQTNAAAVDVVGVFCSASRPTLPSRRRGSWRS